MGLAVVFALFGCGWKLWAEGYGTPWGYQVITYEDLQPDPKSPREKVPPAAEELNEKQVFIKGYMAPTRQQIRLKRFIICPTIGDCKFCNAGLARTKMVRVELTSDLVTDYTTRLVGVGGILKVDPKDPAGIPYSISVERLAVARLDQHLVEKLPRPRRERILEDLARRAVLDHPPLGQHHDAIGRTPRETDLVGDDDQRQPVALQVLQDDQHLVFQLRVQGAGDLVAQQAARLHGHRPGDRHPLLLAAGKLRRISVGAVGQADAGQEADAPLVGVAAGKLQHAAGRLDDVLQRRQVGKQLEILKDHPEDAADFPRRGTGARSLRLGKSVCAPTRISPASKPLSPLMQRKSVDLPAPLGPITATVCPASNRQGDVVEHAAQAELLQEMRDFDLHVSLLTGQHRVTTEAGGKDV